LTSETTSAGFTLGCYTLWEVPCEVGQGNNVCDNYNQNSHSYIYKH